MFKRLRAYLAKKKEHYVKVPKVRFWWSIFENKKLCPDTDCGGFQRFDDDSKIKNMDLLGFKYNVCPRCGSAVKETPVRQYIKESWEEAPNGSKTQARYTSDRIQTAQEYHDLGKDDQIS